MLLVAVFATSKGDIASVQVFTAFTRDSNTIDMSKAMVKLTTVLFISTFDGTFTRRNSSIGSTDPLHLSRNEWEKIISSMMRHLSTSVGYSNERLKMRSDLARVDRVLHECGTEEDRADSIGVEARGLTGLIRAWEGGFGVERDTEA